MRRSAGHATARAIESSTAREADAIVAWQAATARVGRTPAPPFGDPSYPKVGGVTLVGTFCAPASGSSLVDAIVGLPGPGAIVLPMATAWTP